MFGTRSRTSFRGANGAADPALKLERDLEAPSGFEPEMEVLQTSALPLGYGALNGPDPPRNIRLKRILHGEETRGDEKRAPRGAFSRGFGRGGSGEAHPSSTKDAR